MMFPILHSLDTLLCRLIPCTLIFGAWLGLAPFSSSIGAETWGEKLGYPAGKKVLLLHADDIGMCYEANQAAKDYLAKGRIQSAAAMAPCPWFDEFAAWYRENPDRDVGLHLTLTSEWKHYRWGPVVERSAVPGLLDKDGYLHRRSSEVARNATPAEVEKEIRAQIERALARGIRPGHLDTHMGALYSRSEFTEVFLRVAVEYRIPALVIEMTPRRVKQFRAQGYPIDDELLRINREYPLVKLDDFRSVPRGEDYEAVRKNFFALVRSLSPGITEIIFHPAAPSEGLKRITNSWQQRVWEGRLFEDPEVRKFFESEGVLFTNWREMMRRFEKRSSGGKEREKEEAK